MMMIIIHNDDRVVPATTTMRNRLEQALTRGGQREGDGDFVRGETVVVVVGLIRSVLFIIVSIGPIPNIVCYRAPPHPPSR